MMIPMQKSQAMTRCTTLALTALLFLGSASAQQTVGADVAARAELDAFVVDLEAHQGPDTDINISLRLRRFLKENPSMVGEIPGILLRDEPSLDTSATLILALEVTGTPPAQRALTDIYGNRSYRHMDRVRAVIGAGGVEVPTREAISSLWSAAGQRSDGLDVDVSNTAILSIGVAGSHLRRLESPDYLEVRESLVAGLHGTVATDEQTMLLKSIGNLHDRSLGTEVVGYLFAESVPVRASAAQALGLMRDESARPVLLQILEAEPRGVVRAEIVGTLRKFPVDQLALRTVNKLLLDERHTDARAEMAEYLVANLEAIEEARPALVHLANNDPSERVRVIAIAAMRR